MLDFSERCKIIRAHRLKIKGLPSTPLGYEDLYIDEAVECFFKKLNIACIVVSSALVEACLYYELFKKEKFGKKGTEIPSELNKSEKSKIGSLSALFTFIKQDQDLKEFIDPLKTLLHDDETLHKPSASKYIKRRNKFHHGDLFFPIADPMEYLPSEQEEIARYCINDIEYPDINRTLLEKMAWVHLLKTLEFMKKLRDLKYVKYR